MNTIFKTLLLLCLSLSLSTSAMADNKYGLKDKIQDGVILHCFDWTAAQIEAEITNIAQAGFTAVQLSPVHQKEGQSSWYMAYQPYDFYIGNSIATTESLTSLCTAAHNVGVKVIVDVIANHTNGNLQYVATRLQDTDLYHTDLKVTNWNDRSQVITGQIGMKDLATETEAVQTIIKAYIAELKACGVDGIRWDAAKHIGLPSEGDNFWANVPDQTMYNYGEILNNTGGNDSSLFPEYQQYMSITDNSYGYVLANSFSGGGVPTSTGVFNQRGASTAKLVYWGESHDTYSNDVNDGGTSKNMSQNAIDRAYAIAAGNNGATALYFSRPSETAKSSIKLGVKGSTHFTSPEVAEVNHCHNICAGEPNYYVRANQVGAQVRNSGCIMATGNGQAQDVSFTNGDGNGNGLTPGTYTDKVAGGQFTVTTSIISGHVGSTGIAVIYNDVTPQVVFSTNGGSFSETLEVTATLSNATSGTFSINGGAAQSISASGTTFTLGEDDATTYTVTWTATEGTDERSGSVVYNKITPYIPSVTTDEISCFLETTAASVAIWVWADKTKYTGSDWSSKPNMELMGVNAEGKNIFKWTYDGELTAIPKNVIFIPAGSTQTDNLTFTNHGYYIGSTVDHVVTSSTAVLPNEYNLVDADGYNNNKEHQFEKITYTRTFDNTSWQALYIPFAMSYDDWKNDFEVAYINGIRQQDTDGDGVIDYQAMDIVKITNGTLKPNTPYMIKAKTTGEKTITMNNATLYAAAKNSIDCSTTVSTYTFTGSYETISASTMTSNNYYAMGEGSLRPCNSDLKPFRWYMNIESRNPLVVVSSNAKAQIFINLIGEENESTGIKTIYEENNVKAQSFDILGRKVSDNYKGLIIKNGKKFINR